MVEKKSQNNTSAVGATLYTKKDVRYKPRMTQMIRIIKIHYLKFVQLGKFVV